MVHYEYHGGGVLQRRRCRQQQQSQRFAVAPQENGLVRRLSHIQKELFLRATAVFLGVVRQVHRHLGGIATASTGHYGAEGAARCHIQVQANGMRWRSTLIAARGRSVYPHLHLPRRLL